MAAWTLFDLAYRTAREISPTFEGIATGGATTTIIDTVRLLTHLPDDAFNLGTAFLVRDSAGAGAAPEKEFSRITDFVSSTGTVTMAAMTTAVAAGDRYALAGSRYDLDRIISAINSVLMRIKVPTEDTTTLDTAAAQLEYSLPVAVLDDHIEVWLQGKTGDANANYWLPMHNWHIAETGTGTQKLLIFHAQPISSRDLKIVYYIPHPSLYVATDKLRESINIEYVVYSAALELLKDELNKMNSGDKALGARVAAMEEKVRMWSPRSNRQTHKLATFGLSTVTLDEEDL